MGREIGHIELSSRDLAATRKFYSTLFGWKFEMFGDGYAMFKTSKKGLSGGFQLSKKVKPGSTTFYVTVDTIPSVQQKAKSLGGRILSKPKSIGGGMGYWGTIGDPHGNVIGLWSKGPVHSKKTRKKHVENPPTSDRPLTIKEILSIDKEIGNRPVKRGTASETDFLRVFSK